MDPLESFPTQWAIQVWRQRWDKILVFRNVGQGKRCKICARHDEERAQATSQEDRLRVGLEKRQHVEDVLADRNVSVRGNEIAERDAQCPSEDGLDKMLKVQIDGMDQAKFRCPRNLASSAEWDSHWRPQLHVVGALVWGHLEAFFIMDTDQPKDANMNCTVISKVLELVHDKTGSKTLPRNLVIGADNTTRESKNQHFANYLAYLVAKEKFDAVEVQYMTTGHTHNEQDQRFSSVATALKRAPVLEDPSDFAQWILNNVRPARGRRLHVEVLSSTWDFQKWFHGLGVQIAGLAATHLEPDVNHVWRFCRRSMLPEIGVPIENGHVDWQDLENQPSDVVLLVKQFMRDIKMAQSPILVQPQSVAGALRREDLTVMPRNALGDRGLKEYRKTAAAVALEPWKLFKAQQYLEHLCDRNERGELPPGVALRWVWEYKMLDVEAHGGLGSCPMGPMEASDHKPREVIVRAPTTAEQRQRKAIRKRPAAVNLPELEAAAAATAGAESAAAAAPSSPGAPASEPSAPSAPSAASAPVAAAAAAAAAPAAAAAAAAAAVPSDAAAPRRAAGPARRLAPAPSAAATKNHGCSKCRSARFGCKVCRQWADTGHRGYHRGPDNEVMRPVG